MTKYVDQIELEDQLDEELEEAIKKLTIGLFQIAKKNILKRGHKPVSIPPFMTLVQVKVNHDWISLYSWGKSDCYGKLICFADGRTEHTSNGGFSHWGQWRIHPDANQHLHFFDHDGGECPVNPLQKVVVINDSMFVNILPARVVCWSVVKRYAYWHEDIDHD